MGDYNVAIRYTASAKEYEGIVTWTSFDSKVAFDAWCAEGHMREQEVVEEGISQERAVELCRTTPLRSYVSAAISDSTDPNTNEINHDLLQSRFDELSWIEEMRHAPALYA